MEKSKGQTKSGRASATDRTVKSSDDEETDAFTNERELFKQC